MSYMKRAGQAVYNRAGKIRRAVTPGEGAAAAAETLGNGAKNFGRNFVIASQFAGKSKK